MIIRKTFEKYLLSVCRGTIHGNQFPLTHFFFLHQLIVDIRPALILKTVHICRSLVCLKGPKKPVRLSIKSCRVHVVRINIYFFFNNTIAGMHSMSRIFIRRNFHARGSVSFRRPREIFRPRESNSGTHRYFLPWICTSPRLIRFKTIISIPDS